MYQSPIRPATAGLAESRVAAAKVSHVVSILDDANTQADQCNVNMNGILCRNTNLGAKGRTRWKGRLC
jgi:hypothetical protein